MDQHLEEALRPIASLPMEKLIDRFETLNRVNTFLFDAKYQNPDIPALKDAFAKIHLLQKTPVFPAEYPKDPEFSAVAGTDDRLQSKTRAEAKRRKPAAPAAVSRPKAD